MMLFISGHHFLIKTTGGQRGLEGGASSFILFTVFLVARARKLDFAAVFVGPLAYTCVHCT